MTESERLKLTSEVVEEGYEKLDALAEKLEDVDDEIKGTGSNVGADDVVVDVEVRAADAIAKLEAVESAIDSIDRTVTVDVERDGIAGAGAGAGAGATGAAVTGGGRDISGIPGDPTELAGGTEVGGLGVARDASRLTDLPPHGADVEGTDTPLPLVGASARDNEIPFENVDLDLQREHLFGSGGQDIDDAMDMPGPFDRTVNSFRRDLAEAKDDLVDFQFSASAMHELFAALYPLVGVFAGALPAAITGVAALGTAALTAAGALGAIAGLGAMGLSLERTGQVSTQPIANELQQVQDAFVDAFAPLSREFAPIVVDALDQVQGMMTPLASASEALLLFSDEFRGVTEFITSSLPGVVSSLLTFTHALTPIVGGLVNFVANSGILDFMAVQLAEALPALTAIGNALAELLPLVVRVSQGFLDLVGAISVILTPVFSLLNTFPLLAKGLGMVAGSLLLVVGLTSLYTSSAFSAISAALSQIAAFLGLASSAAAAGAGMQIAALGALGLAGVLAAVLLPIIGDVLSGLFGINKQLERAQDNLKKFREERGRIAGDMGGPGGGARSANVYNDNSTVVIDGASSPHGAARSQYAAEYEHSQRVDSIFGN